MFIPHFLDTVTDSRPMGNIGILEVLPERHKDLAQMRTLNDIQRLN